MLQATPTRSQQLTYGLNIVANFLLYIIYCMQDIPTLHSSHVHSVTYFTADINISTFVIYFGCLLEYRFLSKSRPIYYPVTVDEQINAAIPFEHELNTECLAIPSEHELNSECLAISLPQFHCLRLNRWLNTSINHIKNYENCVYGQYNFKARDKPLTDINSNL